MVAEIKPTYDQNRTILADQIPLDTPFSVYVFPTNLCNFKCVYCAHSLNVKEMQRRYDFNFESMSLETYQKVIQQLSKFPRRIKLLSITGQGEPLLNKDIATMVRIAKESGAFDRVEIITNASLLTQDMSDCLISSGLDTLRISMQGITDQKYREVCNSKISFSQLLKNIRYFYRKKKNSNLYVKILDIALDASDETRFYDLFKNCCDRMFIEKMRPTYDGVKITDKLDFSFDRYGRENKERKVCPLAFFMLGILPNGDIKPCDSIYKPIIMGNVHNTTIIEAWNSKTHTNFWLMHLKKGKAGNKYCKICSAPNDVAQPEDILDERIPELIKKVNEIC